LEPAEDAVDPPVLEPPDALDPDPVEPDPEPLTPAPELVEPEPVLLPDELRAEPEPDELEPPLAEAPLLGIAFVRMNDAPEPDDDCDPDAEPLVPVAPALSPRCTHPVM